MSLTLPRPERTTARAVKTAVAQLGGFLLAALACAVTHAQTPAETVLAAEPFRIIAPFPPGGPVDSLASILTAGLTETLMKPVEFATYMRNETAQWARIIKARNIVAK